MALAVEPGEDYTAETVFNPVVEALRNAGLPDLVGFDRDPRFVGSASGRDLRESVRTLLALSGHPGVPLPT